VGQAGTALAGSAWYSAKLLAGEMPDDIEEVFASQGLSLFPAAAQELSMDCSCPEDLLANLHAARSDGPPAADSADRAGMPLAACLDSYFTLLGEVALTSPPPTGSGSLLDQLPPVGITVRGQPLTELLKPAYLAFRSAETDRGDQ
jgi:uncharacterized Zn finger protein